MNSFSPAAPTFSLSEVRSTSATFDVMVPDGNETLEFEVNGVAHRESRVKLSNLLHMQKYLVRAKACFVGGICGDEAYHTFTFSGELTCAIS